MSPLYSLVPAGMWGHVEAFKEAYGPGPNTVSLPGSLGDYP
jgi:peptide/nickel transport system substrate-binding protein